MPQTGTLIPQSGELVVLVDEHDQRLGDLEKHAAHEEPGFLHRAVSAWLTDRTGRVLLQQRAWAKYHFPGRWSNACCTHPRPHEDPRAAIERRVREELGVRVSLRPVGQFIYRAADPVSGLVEHELDHVFTGVVDGPCQPDPAEVAAVRLLDPADLAADLADARRSSRYTPWLAGVQQLVAR